jgi:hypothetical protein
MAQRKTVPITFKGRKCPGLEGRVSYFSDSWHPDLEFVTGTGIHDLHAKIRACVGLKENTPLRLSIGQNYENSIDYEENIDYNPYGTTTFNGYEMNELYGGKRATKKTRGKKRRTLRKHKRRTTRKH